MEDLISQLQSHARGIWQYRWLALGVTWLVAIVGWVAVFAAPNVYQTTARVYVDTHGLLKPLLAGMTSLPNVEQQVTIMSRTLVSRPNVERVMRMADLDVAAATPRRHQALVEHLMTTIRVTGTTNHNIYTISYQHHDPRQVRDVVQALLTIFVEGSLDDKRSDARQAVQFIDGQIKVLEQRLVSAEQAVKLFKLRHHALLPRAGADDGSRLAAAIDALQAAQLDLAEARQTRAAIDAEMNGGAPPGQRRRPTPLLAELDERIGAASQQLDTLQLRYTERHPDLIAARRLLAQLQQRRTDASARPEPGRDPGRQVSPQLLQLRIALAQAEARVAAAGVRVSHLSARHARLLQDSRAALDLEAQLAQLKRDYDHNKDAYARLTGRREAARLSGDMSATTEMMNFRIIDPPTLPAAPTGPNRPLLASLVLFGAACCGAAAALLLSQARPTVAGPLALRALTDWPVIGTVAWQPSPQQQRRNRHGALLLGASAAVLVLLYGAVLAAALALG